jgi:hypothetical protein
MRAENHCGNTTQRKDIGSLSLNDRIAVLVTKMTGTMCTAYIFCAVSLISFSAAIASRDPFVIVSWISQSFLQLVLLPVIMVGQNIMTEHHDRTHRNYREHGRKLDAT